MEDYSDSIRKEIADFRVRKPHLVILGAGASRASCPVGDRNGRELPLMSDFSEKLGLDNLLRSWGIDPKQNFEDIFSVLYENKENKKTQEIEILIQSYFRQLKLPDTPTIYDHLILSLRDTDVIATFNWDPFLIQAYSRNSKADLSRPQLLFLHGNVKAGYCETDKIRGVVGQKCKKCGKPNQASQLLYPIGKKNYARDLYVSSEWDALKWALKNAFMMTIFGYSGPKTDQEAISAMKEAWGEADKRYMEQIAFISLEDEMEITENWEPFIHTHHYELQNNFYDSCIANHPRRTGEAHLSQFYEGEFIDNNPIPKHLNFSDLWKWYEQFKKAENTQADTTDGP